MDVAAARRVLGVEGVASAEQTRAAFHRASLRAHPDKPGGSHEAFVKVTEAYDVLRNGAGAPAQSGFTSGESWRAGAGGHSRGGDAPAGWSGHESESRRFSSSPFDADAETSAARSARSRERAFEAFQRARRAWEPRDAFDDAGEPRGGNGRRAWWDGGRKGPARRELERNRRAARAREPSTTARGDDGRRLASETYDDFFDDDAASRGTYPHERRFEPDIYTTSASKWWDTKRDFTRHRGGPIGFGVADAFGARDDLESMEEYVSRRAWADARGVTGHDRRLHDGEGFETQGGHEPAFLETASPYVDDAGWDAARRRAESRGEDDARY